MKIETRLRLGYVSLVGLLLVIAGGTAIELHRFGTRIERDLGRAYRGASASLAVLDALEREHEIIEAALTVAEAAPPPELALVRPAVRARLDELEAIAETAAERQAVATAREEIERYRKAADNLLAAAGRPAVESYDRLALPAWERARAAVRALLESKQRVMEQAASTARRAAWQRAGALALIVTLALVLFTALSRSLERRVLAPLESLRATAEAVASGDAYRRVITVEDDELGLIGRQLNALLDRQQQLLAESEARRIAERRLLIGVLRLLAPGAFLLRLDGEIAVAPASPESARLAGIGEQLSGRFRALAAGEVPEGDVLIPVAGSRVARCQLLTAADGAPAGWLVRLEDAPEIRTGTTTG